ncbi:MAG: hypothetical protein N3A38_12345 [Planctomycetota bacterium]|nr:hypothetical protein [Planctomycetota bacterium]
MIARVSLIVPGRSLRSAASMAATAVAMTVAAVAPVVLTVAALTTPIWAGEGLSHETYLPVHDSRDAYTPAAAFGKDVYLVVWQSGRFGKGDLRKGFGGLGIADIVGCRVDKSGKPLDEAPFVICGAKDIQERPRVAFGKGVFLVVWHDLRTGKDWDVYAARVAPDGKVLDADGFPVAAAANNQACPDVAWDGNDFAVAWQDFRSDAKYEVYGARVSAEGKVTDAQGVLLYSGLKSGYHVYYPAAASQGGGRSLVLWCAMGWSGAAYRDPPAGGTFLAEGKALQASVYKEKDHGPGRNASPACLAAGTKTYLAAWRTDTSAGRGNAPNGSTAMVLDTEGKPVKRLHVSDRGGRIQSPAAAWDGSDYVVAWHETRMEKPPHQGPYLAVYAAKVSEAGERKPDQAFVLSGTLGSPAAEPAVASDGAGTTLIAYEKHPEKSDTPIKIAFRMLGAK